MYLRSILDTLKINVLKIHNVYNNVQKCISQLVLKVFFNCQQDPPKNGLILDHALKMIIQTHFGNYT